MKTLCGKPFYCYTFFIVLCISYKYTLWRWHPPLLQIVTKYKSTNRQRKRRRWTQKDELISGTKNETILLTFFTSTMAAEQKKPEKNKEK